MKQCIEGLYNPEHLIKCVYPLVQNRAARRDGRVAEGARLESVYTFTGIGGSNPSLSATLFVLICLI
jgi:hypothetical protein